MEQDQATDQTTDRATKFIFDLLRLMLSKKASDMFITAGFPPAFKVNGK